MMRILKTEQAKPAEYAYLVLGIFLLMTTAMGAYGQRQATDGQVTVKNTCKQVKNGIYECFIYIEASEDVLNTIDDVRYTLPSGYTDRKHMVHRRGKDSRYAFSSEPFTTAEEIIVNVKIDYHGRPNAYLSYQVRLSDDRISEGH
jgi:hypothetical protein